MKRNSIIRKVIIFLFLIFIELNVYSQNNSFEKIKLNYDFKKLHPISFKIKYNKIFISDGKTIFVFLKNGKLESKQKFPKLSFIDFDILYKNGGKFSFLSSNGNLYMYKDSSCVLKQKTNGELFKIDSMGTIYYHIQEVANTGNPDLDTTRGVLCSLNPFIDKITRFENIKNNVYDPVLTCNGIIFWYFENYIYSFDIKNNKLVRNEIVGTEMDGTSKFTGFDGSNTYIYFYTGKDIDSFYILDENSNLKKRVVVNLLYKDNHQSVLNDSDFLMECKSGISYYFDGQETIYYMRYTKTGCEIGLLRDIIIDENK